MLPLLLSCLLFVQSTFLPLLLPQHSSGWTWLFNGSSTSQWVSTSSGQFPQVGWEVVGTTLAVNRGPDKSQRGGDIITRQTYRDFELEFEFKLAPGANTGLKYAVRKYPEGAWLGPEYQLIDDEGNKDIASDTNGKRRTASLYELIEPSVRKLRPAGQWNTGRIRVKGTRVEHWLNGTKVVEYERGSTRFLAAKAESKFKTVEDFGMGEGHILLQDHGDEAAFRNIRIREL
jgi:hypothetical protein